MKTEFLKKRSLKFNEIIVAEIEIARFIFHPDVKEISDEQEETHPQEKYYAEKSDRCQCVLELEEYR